MKVTGQKITIYNPTDSNFQPGTIVTIKGNKGYIANYADTNITKFPIGYVINNINESRYGEVLLEGTIEGINTDKFGDASTILYLGGTGNIITTAPTTPVILGSVSNSNEVFGSIYFKVILPAGSGGGPSGPATWGLITGTISSQGDLNTALNGKEPTITAGTTSQYWRGDKTWVNFPSIPPAQVNSDWNSTSGLSEILNKPTIPTVGTWGTLNYPTWTTGTPFVVMTAAGTFALDTNTYLTVVPAGMTWMGAFPG